MEEAIRNLEQSIQDVNNKIFTMIKKVEHSQKNDPTHIDSIHMLALEVQTLKSEFLLVQQECYRLLEMDSKKDFEDKLQFLKEKLERLEIKVE